MFAMFRFLFFTFVAVAVGVFIGTFPIGGQTIAERITAAVDKQTAKKSGPTKEKGTTRSAPQKQVAKPSRGSTDTSKRTARATPAKAKPAPQGPVSAGAANTPDNATDEDREDLAKIIAARARK